MCIFWKSHAVGLRETLRFVVKGVDNLAHALYRFESILVGLIHGRLVKDDQDTFALVKDTCEKEMRNAFDR